MPDKSPAEAWDEFVKVLFEPFIPHLTSFLKWLAARLPTKEN